MANKPNNPSLWSKAKSLAKQKFDVYPSAYANGWAAKYYKSKGGTWRKAQEGMEIPYMAEGGTNNPGFRALPEEVQQRILDNMSYGGYIPEMAYGGSAQQAAIAIAMKKAGKRPKSMQDGGLPEFQTRAAVPYFANPGERDAYRQRLNQVSQRILGEKDHSSYLRDYSYAPDGPYCINGICGINLAAGLKYSNPTDGDRYAGNTKFTDAVEAGREDYYKVKDNFDIGDHLVFLDGNGAGFHSKMIYGKKSNPGGKVTYQIIDNGGGMDFYSSELTDDELKEYLQPDPKGRPSMAIYRPGYSLDKEQVLARKEKEIENERNLSPEIKEALKKKKENYRDQMYNDPNWVYDVADEVRGTPGAKAFLQYANNQNNVNDMVGKLNKLKLSQFANKTSIHDALTNVFGILGQENQWRTAPVMGVGAGTAAENLFERTFKPKGKSIGPGQIRFNEISDEFKEAFDIKKPKDLYNWDKVIPLMTAMDLSNRRWMRNQGERFSERIIGDPGVASNEMVMPTIGVLGNNPEFVEGRLSPYFWRGPGSKNVKEWVRNQAQQESDGMSGEERQAFMDQYYKDNIREHQRVLDPGSYGRKVIDNISKYLIRNHGPYWVEGQDMISMPEVVLPSVKAKPGARRQANRIYGGSGIDGGINLSNFDEYAYGGYVPEMGMGGTMPVMQKGGEPNGSMAMGQMEAVADKMSKLLQFVKPDDNLDPWIASKLAVMDHSADAIADYMMYGPDAEQEGLEEEEMQMTEEEMQQMREGGIPDRYKNMGFNKVGVKKKSNRPGKKWMVLAKKGDQYKVVHGGYKGMQDYTQHRNKGRRKNFWNRMGGKNSSKATDPFSPLYWHKRFGTWEEGGELPTMGQGGMPCYECGGMIQQFAYGGFPYMAEGGIHINPANKGKFTAKADTAGMGVQAFARQVLGAPEGRYPASTRKQANFARNAASWKKQEGGLMTVGDEMEITSSQQLKDLIAQGYEFEIV